ncbi:helicase-related protein [Candidatus Uabimicrobium amorphum]|uniref:Helicase n=1 Tax=Uabimicrobium amorphum TaxID=2596890 RepID=A0A5S9IKF1_UABAM|nr:helicase-related protein [Candidatus Uabimicrobium amorphum]BBM83508.1 helicase [Candidatus Uabimicrobium amorphum]
MKSTLQIQRFILESLVEAGGQAHAKKIKGLPNKKKAIHLLLKNGKITEKSGVYTITDKGIAAYKKMLNCDNKTHDDFSKKYQQQQEIHDKFLSILQREDVLSAAQVKKLFPKNRDYRYIYKTFKNTSTQSKSLTHDECLWFYFGEEKKALKKIRANVREVTIRKWHGFIDDMCRKYKFALPTKNITTVKGAKTWIAQYALSLHKLHKEINMPMSILERYVQECEVDAIVTPEGTTLYILKFFENVEKMEDFYTLTTAHIAAYFDVTLPTVRGWLKKNDISPYQTFTFGSYLYLWRDIKILFSKTQIHPQQVIEHFVRQKDVFLAKQKQRNVEKIQQEKRKILELRDRVITMFPIQIRSDVPKIFFHVGPTNSGKTYKALQRLQSSQKGVYLAPLRLLAWEVYEKINNTSACTLLTGEEVIYQENARFVSATVEMFPQDTDWDVIVLDEAQMAADPERGWAWTRVLAQARGKELHICCIPEIQEFLEEFLREIGYKDIETHTYDRLAPLRTAKKTWSLAAPPPQTIFVVFRRLDVLDLMNRFKRNGINTSVIYGSLPPEVRKNEAEKFLYGETSICVATDAVGMGMNLPAQNVCFVKIEKFDGYEVRKLDHFEVKQIAGRAGRFGHHEYGEVGATSIEILDYIDETLREELRWTKKLRISPNLLDLQILNGSLHRRLVLWQDMGAIPQTYQKFVEPCDMQQKLMLSQMLSYEYERELGLEICFTLVNAPVTKNTEEYWLSTVESICDYGSIPIPREPIKTSLLFDQLYEWEIYVRKLDIFLWLTNRYNIRAKLRDYEDDAVFVAECKKDAVEKINELLYKISEKLSR